MLYFSEKRENSIPDVLLILAGEAPLGLAKQELLRAAGQNPRPLFVAADGGAQHLDSLGLVPDIIIGDDDSSSGLFSEAERLKFPEKKNFTDGVAALDYASKKAKTGLWIFCALGGERNDHMLNNLLSPKDIVCKKNNILFLDKNCYIGYSKGYCDIKGKADDLVSIIPLSQMTGVFLYGLEYKLENYSSKLGDSRMMSNRLIGEKASIRHENGLGMVFHYAEIDYGF